MIQLAELQLLVGKRIDETEVQDADWLEYWPVINQDGIIQEILNNDDFTSEDEVLVDWVNGQVEIVDGSDGFDAVLR